MQTHVTKLELNPIGFDIDWCEGKTKWSKMTKFGGTEVQRVQNEKKTTKIMT